MTHQPRTATALRLTGPVSERIAKRDVGLLERAARAWTAQQEQERRQVHKRANEARERQVQGLTEALSRILQVAVDRWRIRGNEDGFAIATVDGLAFRGSSTSVDGETRYGLMVLDAADNWHEVDSLARLGALDEAIVLARLDR